jgi:2-iminobutanoate/2-iminopropanoate deaminase
LHDSSNGHGRSAWGKEYLLREQGSGNVDAIVYSRLNLFTKGRTGSSMTVTRVQTDVAPQPKGKYSQGVRAGDLLFISGQLPLDPAGELVSGTVADETRQALRNVASIVEAAGGTITNLVQCTIYITDIRHWAEVDSVYGEFMRTAAVLPARTVVPVKEMHYGARVEIQAVAVLA